MPRRLVLVDDNPADVKLLEIALREHGVAHEMAVFEDGERAIEYLESCADQAKPELIIIDLNLPKEDGIEILKRYRNTVCLAETKIAIWTSSDSPRERERAELLGVDAYLHKPLDLDGFMAIGGVLKKLLESRPPSPSIQ